MATAGAAEAADKGNTDFELQQVDVQQQHDSTSDSNISTSLKVEPAPLKKGRKLPKRWGQAYSSPEEKAGLFSRWTYSWMDPVYWVAWNRPLDQEDIWELGRAWNVQGLHNDLDVAWQAEVKRAAAAKASHNPEDVAAESGNVNSTAKLHSQRKKEDAKRKKEDKPSLRRAIWNAWFWRIAPCGLAKFLADMAGVFSPFLVKYILQFVAESKAIDNINDTTGSNNALPPLAQGFGYAIGLLVLAVFQTLLNNMFFQIATTQGMALRSAMIATIYRKTLRLSAASRQEMSAGKVMTIVATDAQRIELFMQFIHVLWTAPVQILAISIFLITQLGPSALAGIGLLVLCGPFQGKIMRRLGVIRKSVAPITDSRVKTTQEIMQGIRVIKFFAWEKSFLENVEEIRRREIKQVFKRGMLQAFVMSLAFGIPIISASLSIVIYAVTNPLDATKIFPALTWFTQLRFPLMFLPQIIVGLADFKVALTRISELLMAPELDAQPTMVEDADFAIKVENGEFVWEAPPPQIDDEKDEKKKGRKAKNTTTEEKEKLDEEKLDKEKHAVTSDDAAAVAVVAQRPDDQHQTHPSGGDSSNASTAVDKSSESGRNGTPSDFTASLRNINFSIPKGALVAIVGPVGSGKSSLLNALIGEMKRKSGSVSFSGTLGYCPQQAWIQNTTLRDNITFGRDFDRTKYLRVLRDCALEQDLQVLSNADRTEIGERGINLSGGQKQRVNLARVCYFDSDIVLLDDPLSAVDSHVGRYLFEQCILGALGNKTRILVTHQLHVLPQVDFVICMKGGEIVESGRYQDLMSAHDGEFANLMKSYGGIEETTDDEDAIDEGAKTSALLQAQKDEDEEVVLSRIEKAIKQTKTARQLMSTEEKATGAVGTGIWLAYMNAAGGRSFAIYLLLLMILVQASRVGTDFWLVEWTNYRIDGFSNGQYVGVYWGWGILQTIMLYVFGIFFAYAGTRAARVLHGAALANVIKAPVRFFDSTPLGRIINRFSKDTDTIDTTLADSFRMFINTFASAVSTFIFIIYATPLFMAPLVPILGIYYIFQKVYRGASRDLKRLDSTTRSPLYASFGETLVGAASIRAYGEQQRFIDVNDARINGNNAPYFLLITAQRWLAVRLEILGGVMVFFASAFGILNRTSDALTAALLGLSLSYALQVTQTLNWCVRQFTETEIALNAVERVTHYAYEVETEPLPAYPPPDGPEINISTVVPTSAGKTSPPPKGWPQTGAIDIHDLTLQYAPDLPAVLHHLTLTIGDKEKVGVVGRTGSGKSTLIQSLFRTIEPCLGSEIKIDGVNTRTIPLEDLRRAISIIPQDPTLFSGTFRSNLDPFGEYDDAALFTALRRAHLGADVAAKGGLDAHVAEGGENLSVGQRQLVCLARAMVKKPRILIMDEATANVDLETDFVVQRILREEFAECTVLCVAHRLNTIIDYDRVLVLSNGRIAEFDTPRALLSNPQGVFTSMVDETGATNADMLKSMVK
ncbi:hypothetical protein PhCBS80983_g02066 [Powellomyces hirtus]|uniref:Uncharacterized protein n=1 Tax=Powellomyces hirtus TaxID=109895 RepID=A0A507E8I0_9FUNG|nr:hypothetical protein PhCBS80983_g02066 [Powellomyces hirtus]